MLHLKRSPLWQTRESSDPIEDQAWHARAVVLDAIFCEEKAKNGWQVD